MAEIGGFWEVGFWYLRILWSELRDFERLEVEMEISMEGL